MRGEFGIQEVGPRALRSHTANQRLRNTKELVELVTKSRTVLSSFAKAKTAKLGRELLRVVGSTHSKLAVG